ncbi:MAG TPA: hypothetical protein VH328_12980 [Burkholderiaceae bacterium]|jgi:hypothetical protein|nr:hypothetical protein [Burkholderiaceae bacterium]
MLSLQSVTAVASYAQQADAPARMLGGTVTTQAHAPASTVVHWQSEAQQVDSSATSPLPADIGVTTGSLPATLCRMHDIAMATGSGTLSDADRAKLQAEYNALSDSVVQAVNTAIQAQGRAEAEAQVQAQSVQQAAATSQHQDASAQGDSSDSRQRSDHAVAQRPDLAVVANATASATARPHDDTHPVAVLNRVQAAQATGLAQLQRQTAAPRPVLSVVA